MFAEIGLTVVTAVGNQISLGIFFYKSAVVFYGHYSQAPSHPPYLPPSMY